jgi:hypothetical protein
MSRRTGGVSASALAVATAFLPALLFPTTYLIAASGGHVDWCVPPVQGCTDITHTGMKYPESHLFRLAMPFVCALFVIVWLTAYDWVQLLGGEAGARERRFRNLGVIAAIALLIGEMVLQGKETLWAIHGTGATLFFILTYAALVLHYRTVAALVSTRPGCLSGPSLIAKRIIVRLLTVMLIAAIAFKVARWREGGRILQWLSTYGILVYVFTFSLDWRGYRLRFAGLTRAGDISGRAD